MTSVRPSVCNVGLWLIVITQCNKKWKSAHDRIGQCVGDTCSMPKPTRIVMAYHPEFYWGRDWCGIESMEFCISAVIISAFNGSHVALSQHRLSIAILHARSSSTARYGNRLKLLSPHSTTPTPTRPTRLHPCEDPREDVGVGVVECGLYRSRTAILLRLQPRFSDVASFRRFRYDRSYLSHVCRNWIVSTIHT